MAKLEFKLPDIGEGVSEGEIVNWLVKAGDTVAEDQDMVEVMTDKATVTIGAPSAGNVAEIKAAVGDTVPVGSVIVILESSGGGDAKAEPGKAEPAKPEAAKPEQSAPSKPEKNESPAPRKDSGPVGFNLPESTETASSGDYYNEKPLAAPATRKLARELGVDLRQVNPSGNAGRVTREDVQGFASGAGGGSSQPKVGGTQTAIAPVPPPAPVPAAPLEERVRITGMRKRIFESMARSKHTAAHFTYVDECECTPLIALRSRLKSHAEAEGIKLNYLPFIVKAVVTALKRHPAMNCLVDDTANEMVLRKTYDIGIAVATDNGLIVPVLRNADRLSLVEIAREIERLANNARNGKTPREDLGGSSFTVTSLGKLGGLLATPVVFYPEVGILFVPEMKKRPVVKNDEIVVGHVMDLSLSFDHRIIDGHVGAAFTQEIIDLLQNPDRLLLNL
jgi:pyruvate dehydrogenase E2 component (dihydrolipoamide acetyltransferase)